LLENIKKYFKDESLLMKSYPWTINLTNLFFLFLVFFPQIFINDFMLATTLYLLALGSWAIFIFFQHKKLLKKLSSSEQGIKAKQTD
tara:strand:- start:480 stop:740 length:261 start_codon:yes stop_codon:yes gene_type:complete